MREEFVKKNVIVMQKHILFRTQNKLLNLNFKFKFIKQTEKL